LLRARLDEQDASIRQLFLSVDGSYTNATILKGLPHSVTLIGRVRKDGIRFTNPLFSMLYLRSNFAAAVL